jgi:hypothetical protein
VSTETREVKGASAAI